MILGSDHLFHHSFEQCNLIRCQLLDHGVQAHGSRVRFQPIGCGATFADEHIQRNPHPAGELLHRLQIRRRLTIQVFIQGGWLDSAGLCNLGLRVAGVEGRLDRMANGFVQMLHKSWRIRRNIFLDKNFLLWEYLDMTIGDRIKQLRESQKLSQYDFGKKIDQSPQVISLYERDKMEPRLKTMRKIMEVFRLSADYFFPNEISHSRKRKTA